MDEKRRSQIQDLFDDLNAKNAHTKGKALEKLGKIIFAEIPEFEFISMNALTATSEIDLIYQIDESFKPRLNISKNFAIIQCKNTPKKAVEVSAVSHLICELLVRKADLGIILTTSEVSPNGKMRANQFFLSNNLNILFFEKKDIERIFSLGEHPRELIREKIYNLFLKQN